MKLFENKRFLGITVATTMLAGVLAGCGNSSETTTTPSEESADYMHLASATSIRIIFLFSYLYFWKSQSTSLEGPFKPQSRGLIILSVKPATIRIPFGRRSVWRPAGREY